MPTNAKTADHQDQEDDGTNDDSFVYSSRAQGEVRLIIFVALKLNLNESKL